MAHADDSRVGRYVSALGLLLLEVKWRDDVADDNSWCARAALRFWERPLRRARNRLGQIDTNLMGDVEAVLAAHDAVEAGGAMTLPEFSAATREGFARCFEGLAKACGANNCDRLRQIGAHIGSSLIAYDCAVDWEQDRRSGATNPLSSPAQRVLALETAQRELSRAAWQCQTLFGEDALTPRILVSVLQRVGRTATHLGSGPAKKASRVRGRHAVVRAGDCDCGGCDCLCHGVGGCADGGGACGDLGGGCGDAPCGDCQADACLCPCDACCWERNRGSRSGQTMGIADPSSVVGMQGHCLGALTPTGLVRVGGKNLAATCRSGHLEDGQAVVVVAVEGAVVLVQPVGTRLEA